MGFEKQRNIGIDLILALGILTVLQEHHNLAAKSPNPFLLSFLCGPMYSPVLFWPFWELDRFGDGLACMIGGFGGGGLSNLLLLRLALECSRSTFEVLNLSRNDL